jgi:hypothetical protein
MENDAILAIGEYECDREHAELTTYFGELALYNRVRLDVEVEGEEKAVFKFLGDDEVEMAELVYFMFANGFRVHLNQTEVGEMTKRAHAKYIDMLVEEETIPDEIPDGWDGTEAS